MALKEEEVLVTSGKKKASVRKETDAVSGMRVTIVPKNQNTLPRRLPSHPSHEVEVCRKKKGIHGKSNRGSILRQTCRYPSVNSTKQKRAAKQGISSCSPILVCILEGSESTRLRMGESLPNHNHEDHIAGKGDNSLQHYNLVHKFILMPQAMKIPAAKAAVDKEWEKWRNFRRGT